MDGLYLQTRHTEGAAVTPYLRTVDTSCPSYSFRLRGTALFRIIYFGSVARARRIRIYTKQLRSYTLHGYTH